MKSGIGVERLVVTQDLVLLACERVNYMMELIAFCRNLIFPVLEGRIDDEVVGGVFEVSLVREGDQYGIPRVIKAMSHTIGVAIGRPSA